MKMRTPSKFSVLNNRYIDQWKVSELKEELKRRNLSIKGLKDDLVKRLDEAIREEEDEEQARNGVEHPPPESVDDAAKVEEDAVQMDELETVVPALVEKTVGNDEVETVVSVQEDGKEGPKLDSQEEKESELINDHPSKVEISSVTEVPSAGLDEEVFEDTLSKTVTCEEAGQDDTLEGKESELINDQPSKVEIFSVTEVPSAGLDEEVCEDTLSKTVTGELGLQDDKMDWENEDSKAQKLPEDIMPSHEDVKLDTSDSNNQVSEVSTNLGFNIKSNNLGFTINSNNSISTDSESINEKNEVEDNSITDNVKLETDVKPEMVQPSSSDLAPDSGESHPKDVEEPLENKVSFEETDNNVTNADMSQKNHSADLGSSEKLNLDRSSGDDSMEEDALESKQIDSNYISEEVGDIMEKTEVTIMKDEDPSAALAPYLPAEEKSVPENKYVEATPSDKRKLPELEVSPINEPSKRQRRWKSENKAREPQISEISSATATDLPEPVTLKRTFSRSYSAGTNDSDATKEREVPPSTKAATNSLRIDRFLRPFTLKAVQELLARTGTVSSFWMDHIKTHCYVTYSSVEECVATRNAVYNLQWPPNGGRHLVADFVDPEEVKLRVDPPQLPAAPVSTVPAKAPEPPSTLPQPSPRQKNLKQQMSEKLTLPPPPPPPLSNPVFAREWGQPQLPPPPPKEKVEAPIMTLDDLFRKTKATPRIYYLPLSEERVSAIVEERLKSSRV